MRQAENLAPSPAWARGMPTGPDSQIKITEAYARMVARGAYFWAWPMVNIYNKRIAFGKAPEPGLLDGILPFAPVNRVAMLRDYIDPAERAVACPNQDVAYGGGPLALDVSPVVIQVPDFGDRFWVYQVVDLRTDSFASLGKMYGTRPGFYLLVGPSWRGETPKGVTRVFRSTTNTGFVAPRVFVDDTPADKQSAQAAIQGIDMYPLSEFDGTMKRHDWSKLPNFASPGSGGGAETKWVFPETFFDQLPLVLADAPPLPGEEARYAEMLAVAAAAKENPALKKALIDEATKTESELVAPLLQFRNWGLQLPHNWSTTANNAAKKKAAVQQAKPKGNLPQAQSDAMLKQAITQLQAVQQQLGSAQGGQATAAVTLIQGAIMELQTALTIN